MGPALDTCVWQAALSSCCGTTGDTACRRRACRVHSVGESPAPSYGQSTHQRSPCTCNTSSSHAVPARAFSKTGDERTACRSADICSQVGRLSFPFWLLHWVALMSPSPSPDICSQAGRLSLPFLVLLWVALASPSPSRRPENGLLRHCVSSETARWHNAVA